MPKEETLKKFYQRTFYRCKFCNSRNLVVVDQLGNEYPMVNVPKLMDNPKFKYQVLQYIYCKNCHMKTFIDWRPITEEDRCAITQFIGG